MDAELIAVGSELLVPGYRDSNSSWLAGELARLGILARGATIVADETDRIAVAVRSATARAGVVLVTGGLGPTADDRTRDALALALERPLELDGPAASALTALLRERGREADADQLRQALRPAGSRTLPNPVGTASGIVDEAEGVLLAALPGVPVEMREMFRASIAPLLRARSSAHLRMRVLKVAGRTESSVDQQVRDLYDAPDLEATILATSTGIELVLRISGATAERADARLAELERAFSSRLGDDLFGADEDTLASVVGHALRASGRALATAESCTAGMLGAAITEVPGSSAWYRGGLIVYSDASKIALAGVPPELLQRTGAVSEEVARALAEGAFRTLGADFGVAITGIAGPDGGSAAKPVGTVCFGIASAGGTRSWRRLLAGGRDLIRRRAVTFALDLLRRELAASS